MEQMGLEQISLGTYFKRGLLSAQVWKLQKSTRLQLGMLSLNFLSWQSKIS